MTMTQLYESNEHPWGTVPDELIVSVAEMLPPQAEVLDTGVGDGRNALYLAQKGHHITGVDLSPAALNILMKGATTIGVSNQITPIVSNINTIEYPVDRYDCVTCNYVLHFLHEPAALEYVIVGIKLATKVGGLVAISDFVSTTQDQLGLREIKTLFPGWEIIKYAEGHIRSKLPDKSGNHEQISISFLARKLAN